MSEPKTKTLIVVVLDESGSMEIKTNDVIGGYNDFLRKQQDPSSTDQTRLTLIKFNTVTSVVHEPMSIQSVPSLSHENYKPDGCTALFDAIADGVRIADNAKQSDERVLCLIMTDGEENSSKKTTLQQVRDIMAAREGQGNWTFTYIGEQPDRWANNLGLNPTNLARYDHGNVDGNFRLMSACTYNYLQQPCDQLAGGFYGSYKGNDDARFDS